MICRLGWHSWKLFRMANSFYAMYVELPDSEAARDWQNDVHRRCRRCGLMQMTTDGGKHWMQRW
jgi:hypothetical protein